MAGRLRDSGWRVTLQSVPLQVPSERSPAQLSVASLGELEPLVDFRVPTYSGGREGPRPARCGGLRLRRRRFRGARARRGGPREGWGLREPPKGAQRRAGRGTCAARGRAVGSARGAELHAGVAGPLPVLAVGRRAARALEPGVEVSLRVNAQVARGTTQNVIADAGEGGRVVMAGAHLDSVPDGHGINDNGSGVAALLEAADALGSRPDRRVRLAFWGAEELGLVGSRHYVRALTRKQRDEIAAYLNFDMVGSPNAVPAVYGDADQRLTRLLHDAHPGREAGVAVDGASDHAPFAGAGIAVSGLYTGSFERGPGGRPRDPCYHLPCDRAENVDRRVLLRMARAAVEALREVEDQP